MTGLPQKNNSQYIHQHGVQSLKVIKWKSPKKNCKVRLINVCFLKIWKKLQKCADKIVRVPPQEWQKKQIQDPESKINISKIQHPQIWNKLQIKKSQLQNPKLHLCCYCCYVTCSPFSKSTCTFRQGCHSNNSNK